MSKKKAVVRGDMTRAQWTWNEMKKNKVAYLMVAPYMLIFTLFTVVPVLLSVVISFTDFNLFKGTSEWGLMNYQEIFTDKKIMKSLGITFSYVFVTVPLKLAFALFIAYILNYKIKGVGIFRTAYYIPSILGGSVAIAVLWKALFRDEGLINAIINKNAVDSPLEKVLIN